MGQHGYCALCIATGRILQVIISTQQIHQRLEQLFRGKLEKMILYLKALHASFLQAKFRDQHHCIATGKYQEVITSIQLMLERLVRPLMDTLEIMAM